MKITKDTLKQLIKEVYKTDMLQKEGVMTVQKQLEYLARTNSEAAQDRLDLRIAIENLNRRMTELEKGT